jgi:hypothetical protein
MTSVGDTLALWALIVSICGTAIAVAALTVAYLDWRQVGMESPWKFTAVGGGLWLLERVHRKPAQIRRFEYGQGCSGLQFGAANPAGIPMKIYRRGDTDLISVRPSSSVETVTIVYKEHGLWDRARGRVPKRSALYAPNSTDTGYESWLTPVYSNP